MIKAQVLRHIAAVGLFLLAAPASAAVVFEFAETGGDVVGTLSGSVDLTGVSCSTAPAGKTGIGINPSLGLLSSGPDGAVTPCFMLFAPQTWGSGGLAFATSTTGNVFLVTGDDLALPEGYVSGSPLSGTLTFASATFASLGITPGSYVYSLPNDTVTVKFGTAPEPGTLALLGLGLAGLVATRKRARLSSWTSRT